MKPILSQYYAPSIHCGISPRRQHPDSVALDERCKSHHRCPEFTAPHRCWMRRWLAAGRPQRGGRVELGVAARYYLDDAASATNWRRSSYLRRPPAADGPAWPGPTGRG